MFPLCAPLTQEVEAFVRGMVPSLKLLEGLTEDFLPLYCTIATRKFLFFGDPQCKKRKGMEGQSILYLYVSALTVFADKLFCTLYSLKCTPFFPLGA